MEPEFLCVAGSPFVELLNKRGSHVALVAASEEFASTVTDAFNKAHYSLLLVRFGCTQHTRHLGSRFWGGGGGGGAKFHHISKGAIKKKDI